MYKLANVHFPFKCTTTVVNDFNFFDFNDFIADEKEDVRVGFWKILKKEC